MSKGRDLKPHIGIFGRRNSGKSSLINALAGQEIAIVSRVAGTTTDPVKKSIEIEGIGPAVLVDTAGIDDRGELGMKRISKTKSVIRNIDLAILVISGNKFEEFERNLIGDFDEFGIPYIIIHNKKDVGRLSASMDQFLVNEFNIAAIDFCAKRPDNLDEVTLAIRRKMPETVYKSGSLLGDIISKDDVVLLVTPIDTEAPEGRMILPQVQAIRDILDNHAVAVVLKESQLNDYIKVMSPKPVLVITDSQVFGRVSKTVPDEIPLTSFSIMLARHKGDFDNYLKGTHHLSLLKDDDRILILESCTHHVTCDDIGRVKIPKWLTGFSGKRFSFDVVAGLDDLPEDIRNYAIVIQCGGCMITEKQVKNRLKPAIDAGVPVTNYGMAIAWVHGIYDRVVAPFIKHVG